MLGGNLVSGAGLLGTIAIAADASGRFQLPVNGSSRMGNFVLQTVFADRSTASGFAFTNAIQARIGQ